VIFTIGVVAAGGLQADSLSSPVGSLHLALCRSTIFPMQPDLAWTEVSRHKCLIYDGHPSQQLPVVVPFLTAGLQSSWRCLYLGSPETVQMVNVALRQRGVDTESEMKRGALLFSSERSHLERGSFDARAMVDGICELIDNAVRDGFEGLCATGDMRWELGPDENFDRLIEYEALLEQVFREKPLLGICQYHRDVIPARTIREALVTHRTTYIGDTLNRDNLFYMPPELLLERDDKAPDWAQGEWMCQQIMRVLKAEQARDQALSSLEEMNRNLERRIKERTSELEIVNQQLEAFSYSVSHDLRAPLRSITGFSDILAEEAGQALSPESKRSLEHVRSSARHMSELIDGLLAMARIVKTDLNRTAIDLSAMATEVEREIRQTEPSRSAEFAIDHNVNVVADRVLLRCVLSNLLGNAWKYTAKRAHAHIHVGKIEPETGATVFFIKDNGAGFEMRYADRLFSPFQRLHTQDEFPGIGVGLATVQRIIMKHGGRIWAESRPDHGATFFFTLSADPSGA
jgi:signal transduction histidine kinase